MDIKDYKEHINNLQDLISEIPLEMCNGYYCQKCSPIRYRLCKLFGPCPAVLDVVADVQEISEHFIYDFMEEE